MFWVFLSRTCNLLEDQSSSSPMTPDVGRFPNGSLRCLQGASMSLFECSIEVNIFGFCEALFGVNNANDHLLVVFCSKELRKSLKYGRQIQTFSLKSLLFVIL